MHLKSHKHDIHDCKISGRYTRVVLKLLKVLLYQTLDQKGGNKDGSLGAALR